METGAYWERREARLRAEAASDAEYAASDAGRIDRLMARVELMHAHRGGYSDAERAAADAELASAQAELDARRAAAAAEEWTRERTVARRAAWNAAVKAGAVVGAGGKVDWSKVRALEVRLGFRADDLKAAVARHAL